MYNVNRQIPKDIDESNPYRVYRLLLILCETNVLSRACDILELSVPTASRLLSKARDWFDDPLFVPSAGRMYPSRRMESLKQPLYEAIHSMEALFVCNTAFDPTKAESIVRIVAIDNAFYTLLTPVILELNKEAPGIHFQVFDRFHDMIKSMREGELDLAFYSMEGKPRPADFHEQTLFKSNHVLLVRRGHPLSILSQKRRLTFEDVGQYNHVGVAITMATRGPRLIIGQQAQNLHDKVCCEMPFFVAGASLVAESDLVMRTPRETALRLAKSIPLDVLRMEETLSLPWHPGLFWHESTANSPLLTWVRARVAVKAKAIFDQAEIELPFT